MIIGIDFGTSKSVAAVHRGGQPRLISDVRGRTSMPSVVLVSPDQSLHVGWDALEHPLRYESNWFTINSVKRLMGKAGRHSWGDYLTWPQEVSALILARLKLVADVSLEDDVTGAVIAVPAHYDINQRWATLQAAEIAGLEAVRLVNEASAAAMAYAWHRQGKPSVLAVFDFGAGTLDVSIVEVARDRETAEGTCRVLSTAGSSSLGGDDFDAALISLISQKSDGAIDDPETLDPVRRQYLREVAQRAKEELSASASAGVHLPGFIPMRNGYSDLSVEVTREELETACEPLLGRVEEVVKRALAALRHETPTELLLVGGTSMMPAVRETALRAFDLPLSGGVSVSECVAQGASILAAVLQGQSDVEDLLLLDVLPLSYSIELKGGVAKKVLERNTVVPVHETEQGLSTTVDNQVEIAVRVYQGERPMAADNTFVGQLRLTDLPPAPAGTPQFEAQFSVDEQNVLTVKARDLGTGRDAAVVMEGPYKLNDAQISALSRRVSAALGGVRSHELIVAEGERDERARKRALSVADAVDSCLSRGLVRASSEERTRLESGSSLIRDYVQSGRPAGQTEHLASMVESELAGLAARSVLSELRELSSSDEVSRVLAAHAQRELDLSAIDALAGELRSCLGPRVQQIRLAFSSLPGSGVETLTRDLATSDTRTACLARLVFGESLEHLRLPLDVEDSDRETLALLDAVIFGSLGGRASLSSRRWAANHAPEILRGRDPTQLLGLLLHELDAPVVSALTKCLEPATPEMWLRAYSEAEEDQRKRIRAVPGVATLLQQRLVECVKGSQAAAQNVAASALRETGIGLLDPQELEEIDLAGLPEAAAADVAALMVLSSCDSLCEIGLTALVDARASVRHSAAQAVENRRYAPSEALDPIIGIAKKLILEDSRITRSERRVLRRAGLDSARLEHLTKGLERLAPRKEPWWRLRRKRGK